MPRNAVLGKAMMKVGTLTPTINYAICVASGSSAFCAASAFRLPPPHSTNLGERGGTMRAAGIACALFWVSTASAFVCPHGFAGSAQVGFAANVAHEVPVG